MFGKKKYRLYNFSDSAYELNAFLKNTLLLFNYELNTTCNKCFYICIWKSIA